MPAWNDTKFEPEKQEFAFNNLYWLGEAITISARADRLAARVSVKEGVEAGAAGRGSSSEVDGRAVKGGGGVALLKWNK